MYVSGGVSSSKTGSTWTQLCSKVPRQLEPF